MEDEMRVEELLQEMREITLRNSSTKDEVIPEEYDLSKGELDEVYDLDIFFSRKPGMRRSIQLISSGSDNEDYIKLSCMTALASLCDTMIANKPLNVTEEDIVRFMIGWLDMHHIKIADLRKNS